MTPRRRRTQRGPTTHTLRTTWCRAFAVASAVLVGCTQGSILAGKIRGSREIAVQAERNGARRCAPKQLAIAQAHLEFAETELAQGDPFRAEEHYEIADPNARAAFEASPAARCAPRGVAVVRPAPGDRDGDGILDAADRCPDAPEDLDGFEDEDGCAESQDVDGDSIVDERDLCPAEPEDADGVLDEDGCPDLDDDADGVLDAADRCRAEPEDVDAFQDDDGCPDLDDDSDGVPDATDRCPREAGPPAEGGCPRVYRDVVVTDRAITITQKIHFETNRATIRPVSFGILDTVAQVLRDFPTLRIEVQGHTDSQGNDDYNLRLSQSRAEAVRAYLIEHGIQPNRLTARGYGETQPVESNATHSGRATNRRVEFIRIGPSGEPAGAGGDDGAVR